MHKLFDPKRLKAMDKERKEHGFYDEESDFIYRSYHRSFKIMSIRFYALYWLNACLYILGLTNSISRSEDELVKQITPHIRKDTFTWQIFDKIVNDEFMSIQKKEAESQGKKVMWYKTDPWVIPYLGYYSFFRIMYNCLYKYAKTRTGKEPYARMISEYEGAAEYFIHDLAEKDLKKFKGKLRRGR